MHLHFLCFPCCLHLSAHAWLPPVLPGLKGELQGHVSWYLKLHGWDKWTSQKACVYLNRRVDFEGGWESICVKVNTILLTINLYNHFYLRPWLWCSGQLEIKIVKIFIFTQWVLIHHNTLFSYMGIKLYENNLLKGSINLRVNAKLTLKELKKK